MITIGLEQIKDCDHCSKTYGTFGCCTTVNNQWVYSCTEGQKEYIIDRVFEIINQMDKENEECNGNHSRLLLRIEHRDFRERVLALKGGTE